MAIKRGGLGKGLDSLIPKKIKKNSNTEIQTPSPAVEETAEATRVEEIEATEIENPFELYEDEPEEETSEAAFDENDAVETAGTVNKDIEGALKNTDGDESEDAQEASTWSDAESMRIEQSITGSMENAEETAEKQANADKSPVQDEATTMKNDDENLLEEQDASSGTGGEAPQNAVGQTEENGSSEHFRVNENPDGEVFASISDDEFVKESDEVDTTPGTVQIDTDEASQEIFAEEELPSNDMKRASANMAGSFSMEMPDDTEGGTLLKNNLAEDMGRKYTGQDTEEGMSSLGITADSNDMVEGAGAQSFSSPIASGEENGSSVIMMRTSLVEPNREQPRKKFNDATIEELADSIRLYGVIQPLLVQKKKDYYEIIAGERRWRAAKKAGLREIPVIIREYTSQEAAEVALIENIQREDLNPIEEAQAYDRLIREFSLTQEEVAAKVARSRSAITNSLRLLRLCEDVRDMVIRGDLSEGHARAILALPSPGHQKMLAEQVIADKLSVRETEKLVRKIMKPAKEARAKDTERQAILGNLGNQLTNVLGTRVAITDNGKGKGKIEIDFYSDEELERILELLRTIH